MTVKVRDSVIYSPYNYVLSTIACHLDCNYCLMRCTGNGSDECCLLFDNGMCATSCNQTNHVANEQNNYACC